MLEITKIKTHPLQLLAGADQHYPDIVLPAFETGSAKELAAALVKSYDLGTVESAKWQKTNQRLRIVFERDDQRFELSAQVSET